MTYLVCFAMKNAISWGIHLDFHDSSSHIYVHGKSLLCRDGICSFQKYILRIINSLDFKGMDLKLYSCTKHVKEAQY